MTTAGNPRGGHGAPTWSPDGSRLYFVTSEPRLSQAEIWSVKPDGTDLVRLHAGTRLYEPRVSPDGKALWFGAQNEQGSYALYRLPLGDGGRTVTGPAEAATALHADVPRSPSFSADGRRVAWSELTTTGVDLEPARRRGHGPAVRGARRAHRRVTAGRPGRSSLRTAAPSRSAGSRPAARTTSGSWTPTADTSGPSSRARPSSTGTTSTPTASGSSASPTGTGGKFAAYEFEIATRTFRKLPVDLTDAISIRLSPDGKRIAYHSKRDSITINTWMADLTTRTQQKLTFDREFVGYPCWSPDGKELALEVRRGDDIFIGVMPSAGGTPELLNEKRGLSWAFSYSPDGRRIAFAGYRDDTWNLWWIDRKTREEKRLTENTRLDVYIRYPSWSPKGDRIVYEQAETRGQVFLLDGGPATPPSP